MAHKPRVSESQRELVLAFMEEHPEVTHKAAELQHGLTVAYKRRLWQQLADTLNAEGPVVKTTLQWQEWWRRQLHEARHDAAAVTEAQRCTVGGGAPGFRGRVLQVTGMSQVAGLPVGLPYQEASVPRAAQEVEVQSEEAGGPSTATQLDQPPQEAGTQEVATAPVLRRRVRPRPRLRPRRADTLVALSSQCAHSVSQGDEMLRSGQWLLTREEIAVHVAILDNSSFQSPAGCEESATHATALRFFISDSSKNRTVGE
ncbi:hypothetical protein HPB50_028176 [Hyalomma asiaticum]|nr:hypothetical protein HPB50_028176 [Hyalomma asiaticum]